MDGIKQPGEHMDDYRKEVSDGLKDARWTFFRGLPLLVIIVIVLAMLGFGLRSAGILGKTAVERSVFENSFQYSEARKAEIATLEAQLAEIARKMTISDLDKTTKENLSAHASVLRIQLSVARSK